MIYFGTSETTLDNMPDLVSPKEWSPLIEEPDYSTRMFFSFNPLGYGNVRKHANDKTIIDMTSCHGAWIREEMKSYRQHWKFYETAPDITLLRALKGRANSIYRMMSLLEGTARDTETSLESCFFAAVYMSFLMTNDISIDNASIEKAAKNLGMNPDVIRELWSVKKQ